MANTNLPLLRTARPAGTVSGNDLYITRQGSDTEDRGGLVSQLVTYIRTAIYGAAGQGVIIKGGTNSRAGTSTLVAGTVTVANTSVTANTLVFAQIQNGTQTNASYLRVTTSAGVGFTITSGNAADTSGVAWVLVEVS